LKVSHPVFMNSKFLIGYHHSSNVYVLAGDYLTWSIQEMITPFLLS